jgi:hypothetical protein
MGAMRVGRAREQDVTVTPWARAWASRVVTSLRWRSRRYTLPLLGVPSLVLAAELWRAFTPGWWPWVPIGFLAVLVAAGVWTGVVVMLRPDGVEPVTYAVYSACTVAIIVLSAGLTPTAWLFKYVPVAPWSLAVLVWVGTLFAFRLWLAVRDHPDDVSGHPLEFAWEEWVTPKILPESWLTDIEAGDDKVTAVICWARELGRTADDVIAKEPQIRAALRAQVGTLVLEVHDEGSHAASLTLFRQNPLAESSAWPGPTWSDESGIAEPGTYSDGTRVGMQFLSVSGGRGGLIAGATDAGKSAFISWMLREAYDSGVIVPIFLDAQEGVSAPEWTGHVAAVHGAENCAVALNLIAQHVMKRSSAMGRKRLKKYRLTDRAVHGLPPILLIVDELPVLIESDYKSQVVTALNTIAQTGRKVGIAPYCAVQTPLLEAFGGGLFAGQLASQNTVMFRLDKRSGAAMLGGQAATAATQLPINLPGRRPTSGMAFTNGVDGRAVPWRSWHPDSIPTPDQAGPANGDPELDDLTRNLLDALPVAGDLPDLPDDEDDEPQPLVVVQQRPSDAQDGVRQIVRDLGGVATTAQIVDAASARWGYSESSVTKALRALVHVEQQRPGSGMTRNGRGEYVTPATPGRKAS